MTAEATAPAGSSSPAAGSFFFAASPSKEGELLTNVNEKVWGFVALIYRAGQQLANGISGTHAIKGGEAAGRKKRGGEQRRT